MTPTRPLGRLAVLVSGNGSNLQALLDAADAGTLPARVVLVASDRPDAYGLQRARDSGVPAHVVDWQRLRRHGGEREGFDRRLADLVARHNPDLVVLAGFMRVLTPAFLRHFEGRVLNLHPALPGAFPGVRAIERAHEACRTSGLRETGVMVHRVVPEVDAGPPVAVESIPLDPSESLEALTTRVHAVEHRILPATVAEVLAALPDDEFACRRAS